MRKEVRSSVVRSSEKINLEGTILKLTRMKMDGAHQLPESCGLE